VIGTASARHTEFLKSLGVSRIVDYTDEHWEDAVNDVDVAIDTVGGDTATAALRTLRKGGTFISVVRQAVTQDQCTESGVRCLDDFAADAGSFDDATMVRQLIKLVNRRQFRVHVDKRFSIEQAAEAQEYNRQGHSEGKVVIEIGPGEGSRR
jgi:NADPH:quinone reductase-like Zn-dependent oxidoreductase